MSASNLPSPPPAPLAETPLPAATRHWRFWLIALGLTMAAIYVLRGVLLPFVAGAAVAYFLDPIADWLERRGLSRVLATVAITVVFLLVLVGAILLLIPALHDQITGFVERMPTYAQALHARIDPLLAEARKVLPPQQVAKLREGAAGMVGDMAGWALGLIKGVLTSGLAVINVLSLLVITPVVTFYLLRDWDRMVATVDSWLPRAHAEEIRGRLREIDTMLAGFVRGQASVCLALGTFYAIGLSLVGLDLGLVVGLGTGLISFIPYVGTVIGFLTSMGLAFAQFSDALDIVLVAGVFMLGQFLEGNFLSPWLVGERIGLHPVWMIFALLAGGTLFGFLGILLAVPVAAVVGVLVRYGLKHYLASPLYRHGAPPEPAADEPHGDPS